MALRELTENQNLYTASSSAKIPKAKELDYTNYNKLYEERKAEVKKYADLAETISATTLPLAYQYDIDNSMSEIDKAVAEGLSVESTEYKRKMAELGSKVNAYTTAFNEQKTRIKDIANDPTKAKNVKSAVVRTDENGNQYVVYTDMNEGLTNFGNTLNTIGTGKSPYENIANINGVLNDALTTVNYVDLAKLNETAAIVFKNFAKEKGFDVSGLNASGVYVTSDGKELTEPQVREQAVTSLISQHYNELTTLLRLEGKNANETNIRNLADSLIAKQMTEAKAVRGMSASDAYQNYQTGKTKDETPLPMLEVDYNLPSKEGVLGINQITLPTQPVMKKGDEEFVLQQVRFDTKSGNYYLFGSTIVKQPEKKVEVTPEKKIGKDTAVKAVGGSEDPNVKEEDTTISGAVKLTETTKAADKLVERRFKATRAEVVSRLQAIGYTYEMASLIVDNLSAVQPLNEAKAETKAKTNTEEEIEPDYEM